MTTIYSPFSAARALLFSFILLIASHFSGFGQQYFTENFNSTSPGSAFPTGWQAVLNGAPNTEWKIAASPFAKFTLAMNGSNFAICDADAGGSGSTTNSTLTSPAFNSSAANLLFLELSQAYRDYSATPTDSAIIEVFNGTNWIVVQKKNTSTAANGVTPEKVTFNISGLKNANMRVRFRYVGFWPWFWGLDDIRIFQPPANDLGVSAINSPVGDCGLSAATPIKIQITNFGSVAQTSIPASYRIGTGASVNQTFTGNLAPGASQEFTFSGTANLGAPGNYTIQAWTRLVDDQIANNDSTKSIVNKVNPIGLSIVNFQSFDGTNLSSNFPGWREASGLPPTGTTSNWRPSTTAQSAAFNTITGTVNLFTSGKREWIISPNVPVGPNTGLVFKTAVTAWQTNLPSQMGSDDSLKIMVSTNCGASWIVHSFINRAANLSNQLTQRVVPLSVYNGQEIRIGLMATEGIVDDLEDYDFHVDDIEIRSLPDNDLAVSGISSPISGCTGSTPVLTAQIANVGILPQSNFPVCYQINSEAPVCTTITSVLNSNQTLSLSFPSASPTLSIPGNYTLRVYTNLANDAIRASDTLKNYQYQNIPLINSFPYFQSFEANNGGWIPGGNLTSWELGTPAKSVISGAAHGTKAYTTGGLGNAPYNNNEKSFVLSPCMDFTNLPNPVFEMRAWWHSESDADGACLQASTNEGSTWTTVGGLNAVTNWYNSTTLPGLSGFTPTVANPRNGWSGGVKYNNGSNGWVLVRTPLTGLGGQGSVRLRIVFGADATFNGDGFAFDAIRISQQPKTELAFVSIERPLSGGCGLNANAKIVVRVQNTGRDTISNIQFGYRIGSGTPVSGNGIGLSIFPNQFYNFEFPSTANLSSGNQFSIFAWAKAQNDVVAQNDSGKLTVKRNSFFTDTLRFRNFNGVNLPFIMPGWSMATGDPNPTGPSILFRAPLASQLPYSGPNAVRINMFNNNRNEWIMSPGYRISSNSFFSFEVSATNSLDTVNDPQGAMNGTDDKIRFLVSTNCGDSWTELVSYGNGDGLTKVFKRFQVNLSAYSGQEIRMALKFTTGPVNNQQNDYDLFIRDGYIVNLSPNDVGVSQILSPTISCGLGDNTPIRITVRNFGSNPVSNIPVFYQINSGPKVFGLIPGPVPASQSVVFQFNQTANLGLSQPYTIEAGTELVGDSTLGNDMKAQVLSKLVVPVPVQNLSAYNGSNLTEVLSGWNEAKGPTAVAGTSSWTNGIMSGLNCWKVKLANAQKQDWIVSPGVRLSNGNFLKFSIGQFSVGGNNSAQFDVDDSVSVMVSTNCGTNWRRLQNFAKNTSPALINSLQQISIPLNAYANQEVRFAFRAVDGTRRDDTSEVYITNFEINSTLSIDAGPTQVFFDPAITSSVFVEDSLYKVVIRINNFATQPCSNISAGVRFANGLVLSRVFQGTINSGQSDTLFMGYFQPANPANNQIARVYSTLSGDQGIENDTLLFNYSVLPITSNENFIPTTRVMIFPNPADSRLFIRSSSLPENARLVLIDNMGRTIFDELLRKTESNQIELTLPNIPAGIYQIFLRNQSGEIFFSQKQAFR
jgi:hypothetical protein